MEERKLKPCPCCKDAWIYASEYSYGSDYGAFGYTVKCMCGYAWRNYRKWHDTKEEAINDWNSRH